MYRRCWAGDINPDSSKVLDSLTSTSGYIPLIDKSTFCISGGSSCIDLIFCKNSEVVNEYGIDHSFFQKCHNNLVFAKISANVSLPSNCSRECSRKTKIHISF